jgi:site-specific DNA-methyltransferase (adenine-specific)
MEILRVNLDELELDSENARFHSGKSIRALAKSLEIFGQRKPIVITSDSRVVAGNGTVRAASELGWDSVDAVLVPDDWGSEKVKAFAIADNRTAELSEWDNTVLREQLLQLEEEAFSIEWLEFDKSLLGEEKLLDEFPSFDDDTETLYQCPKCRYEWNGAPR